MAFHLSHARTEGARTAGARKVAPLRQLVAALRAPCSFDITKGTITQCRDVLNDLGPFDLELSWEQLGSLLKPAIDLILRGKGVSLDPTLTKRELIDEILGTPPDSTVIKEELMDETLDVTPDSTLTNEELMEETLDAPRLYFNQRRADGRDP